MQLTTKAIDALFAFEPFFEFATVNAREKIVKRADSLGVGWGDRVDSMRRSMDQLQAEYDGLLDTKVCASVGFYVVWAKTFGAVFLACELNALSYGRV